jgi:hypothetical protein
MVISSGLMMNSKFHRSDEVNLSVPRSSVTGYFLGEILRAGAEVSGAVRPYQLQVADICFADFPGLGKMPATRGAAIGGPFYICVYLCGCAHQEHSHCSKNTIHSCLNMIFQCIKSEKQYQRSGNSALCTHWLVKSACLTMLTVHDCSAEVPKNAGSSVDHGFVE